MEKVKNIWAYIQGNIRYSIYYSDYKYILPGHIVEQIDYRIKVMDPRCYQQGSCIMCGCATTALQMANKSCDKPCYPKMKNKKEWKKWENEKMGKC